MYGLVLLALISAAIPAIVAQTSAPLRHFSWLYPFDANGQPQRDWYEQLDGGWYEVYPSGNRTHFAVLQAKFNYHGTDGQIVESDAHTVFVFVPEHLANGMPLYFWKTASAGFTSQPGLLANITLHPSTRRAWSPNVASAQQDLGELPPGESKPSAAGSPDDTKRNELLLPALTREQAGDPAGALAALAPALAAYPSDPVVLGLAGRAAHESGNDQAALAFYNRGLATHPARSLSLRLGRMKVEARLAMWTEFDADRLALRAAKKNGDPDMTTLGYAVDEITIGNTTVEVIYYPLLAGGYNTLYRFLSPKPAQSSPQAAGQNSCNNPNFRPYIDLESDTFDQPSFQKDHPDLAAKGERRYSLDSYPAPCSQALMGFFDGEPKYQDIRRRAYDIFADWLKPIDPVHRLVRP